ncbi:hypothetical protein [Lactobacillus crispatus]|jgi:hypothetical protein|uniref:ABC transporter permease n=1 Tax=Lactobacillus crispatus TaxID=47770 RepID=A0AAW8WNV5_9LACO|nr:hypothetical protein [Lactobacillus crispatus]MCT7696390.1 hypothetical protein [Lactobacillus crispatus]MCT7707850.1 hypothetical protein [Lactobacillus crispatus]MCT7731348.1 hypothetical protein [Lactobacillus crispatus]MCT7802734.1 hypothetical protein [Lactobacillus crispatus]MCT7808079.1 hypothetical protein [Lactobacillus crispatus]
MLKRKGLLSRFLIKEVIGVIVQFDLVMLTIIFGFSVLMIFARLWY